MNKTVFVINGAGGVGKDTLCRMAGRAFRVMNISTITPIKRLAAQCGWKGEKTDEARKFLSDLKRLTADYNDFPTNWVYNKYQQFLTGDKEILFVHIREPEEIKKFVDRTGGRARTLLIRGGERFSQKRQAAYGNRSDDGVEEYAYDYIFMNDRPLKETQTAFVDFLREILAD
jgi:hypothetical protein